MASEEQNRDVANTTGQERSEKLPTSVVLGKDGKPCRSCTSFAAWKAMSKNKTRHDSAAQNQGSSVTACSDCPPDVETLGRGTWTLLHSIAATYPEMPSKSQQSDMMSFVKLFSKLYPCWVCAKDFQSYLGKESPRVQSRDEFGKWLCDAHNEVNRKLGKPQFDCSRWDERWRTGWKDGRCD
ncbi:hypothetical protein E4U13_001273 [Claviceps humidiphila]|uniref:Sulfhydryl oxidase n=1 Tax=Claviceps humidiphila TaxID=1294629 RepID=A0A9P7Q0E8_9HYPO|nr:hypothetical protein E4U32_003221 [Claviceps aff. humidiphila group G2b]KAG6117149.1 hypothetical protein E4U13_001273 [Claviceps humidiphila]